MSGHLALGKRLDAEVRKLDHRLDQAVRAWSMRNEQARASVKRVDARRVEYLASLHSNKDDALLAYATFIGLQHLGILKKPALSNRLNARLRQALTQTPSTQRGRARH